MAALLGKNREIANRYAYISWGTRTGKTREMVRSALQFQVQHFKSHPGFVCLPDRVFLT